VHFTLRFGASLRANFGASESLVSIFAHWNSRRLEKLRQGLSMTSPRPKHKMRQGGHFRAALLLAILGQAHAGTFTEYDEFRGAVRECTHNIPSSKECCSSGAADCGAAGTTDMPDWVVSNLQNMKQVFSGKGAFKEDISRWDVREVESMDQMFLGAAIFDVDITGWDTSSLVSSNQMF
tara:strand:- start:593 stop:1129 length:537 start_codon:yes stop_codon:yes gene_type:complete